jgi:hypothetical protein
MTQAQIEAALYREGLRYSELESSGADRGQLRVQAELIADLVELYVRANTLQGDDYEVR